MQENMTEEVRKGAGLAALSYVFFLCIFVLVYDKNNQFARYHARQSLVMFISLSACWMLAALLERLWIFHTLGGIINFFGTVIYLIYALIGIFSSLMGLKTRLPLISDVAERLII